MTKRMLLCMVFALAVPGFASPSRVVFEWSPSGVQQLVLNGGAVTLNATFTGWWTASGDHSSNNPNYVTGFCGSDHCGTDQEYRGFFVFDLSTVPVITSAQLSIGNNLNSPGTGYFSANPTESLSFWDVSTSIANLTATNTGQTGIFSDLGAGVLFGTRSVSAADNGTQVLTTLNANAIAALNAARGGTSAFGSSLNLGPSVPEPASWLLLSAGLAGMAFFARGYRKPTR